MTAAATAIAIALLTPAPAATDETVRAGLKWLAFQQKADGSWEGGNGFAPTTLTATAGLALLMEGSTPKTGALAPYLRRTVAWLEKNTSDKGQIGGTHDNEVYQYIHTHSHALLFLACAYDADDDPDRRERMAKLLAKATAFLAGHQTKRGGWGFVGPRDGNDPDDSQSTATVLHALLAVRKAGIDVPKTTTDAAVQYLAKATNKDGGVIYSTFGGVAPMGNDGQPFLSAQAASGALLREGAKPEILGRWVRNAGGTDMQQQFQYLKNGGGIYAMLQQYHLARLAFAVGENGHRRLDPDVPEPRLFRWSAHRAKVFKELKALQTKDGNWPDAVAGPVYVTALALVILQLDNGYLPAFSR